jgi:hypothetical protein
MMLKIVDGHEVVESPDDATLMVAELYVMLLAQGRVSGDLFVCGTPGMGAGQVTYLLTPLLDGTVSAVRVPVFGE